ncbi:ribosome biogenesis GTPase YlqF [Aceticella autotrophica]|uniref:Ribosome biogenesis GTPase A n=1 Tax=Aceticella autotrophica TaxID=2755338 RepID=A0A975AUE0_9THEO|nr:ribosome biogenesis GTPase YlqF [Aceticella autotrophica]QSZ26630.1 ribosome biogenesis GTPase YlqF [Aceticella autotrophica]
MIQWYPGHMAKTKRLIEENLKLVDIVYEILDARIPYSSKNPIIDELILSKKRLVLLNKADLSDKNVNNSWISYYKKNGIECISINSLKGDGLKSINDKTYKICEDIIKKKRSKGITPRLRVMILGIPNVGKSTLINKLSGAGNAKTGNIPGVTKSKQWIKTQYFDLLDTPGILWPKFEDENVALMLAITGAIKDELLNIEEISIKLLSILKIYYPQYLLKRYNIINIDLPEYELLKNIGEKRGCLVAGGEIDVLRAAKTLIDDFRSGKLGNISLERPE